MVARARASGWVVDIGVLAFLPGDNALCLAFSVIFQCKNVVTVLVVNKHMFIFCLFGDTLETTRREGAFRTIASVQADEIGVKHRLCLDNRRPRITVEVRQGFYVLSCKTKLVC